MRPRGPNHDPSDTSIAGLTAQEVPTPDEAPSTQVPELLSCDHDFQITQEYGPSYADVDATDYLHRSSHHRIPSPGWPSSTSDRWSYEITKGQP